MGDDHSSMFRDRTVSVFFSPPHVSSTKLISILLRPRGLHHVAFKMGYMLGMPPAYERVVPWLLNYFCCGIGWFPDILKSVEAAYK